jgi:hypothetical protein
MESVTYFTRLNKIKNQGMNRLVGKNCVILHDANLLPPEDQEVVT